MFAWDTAESLRLKAEGKIQNTAERETLNAECKYS
jgi:hypothetical protein